MQAQENILANITHLAVRRETLTALPIASCSASHRKDTVVCWRTSLATCCTLGRSLFGEVQLVPPQACRPQFGHYRMRRDGRRQPESVLTIDTVPPAQLASPTCHASSISNMKAPSTICSVAAIAGKTSIATRPTLKVGVSVPHLTTLRRRRPKTAITPEGKIRK